MIILTIVCDRCGKKLEQDLSNTSFTADDMIRKAGLCYVHANKKNMLICGGCNNQFEELKGTQEKKAYKEVCEFFNTCGKEKDERDNKGKKNE